jgi:hypothetical protein
MSEAIRHENIWLTEFDQVEGWRCSGCNAYVGQVVPIRDTTQTPYDMVWLCRDCIAYAASLFEEK